jgi:hypothetical protein
MAQQTEEYSPYCKICSGCGEEGCCSPLSCKQGIEGQYCETYLNDLKFGYSMNRYFVEKIWARMSEELKKEYDEEWDKMLDKYYQE